MSRKKREIKRACKYCGKEFWIAPLTPTQVKKREGQYCSEECSNTAHGIKMRGEGNSNWKGGVRDDGSGRILVYLPDHPYATQQGYVYRYRLVMEEHLGRPLLPTEVVHHINSIKDDDRVENLMLFSSNEEHSRHHCPKGTRVGDWGK